MDSIEAIGQREHRIHHIAHLGVLLVAVKRIRIVELVSLARRLVHGDLANEALLASTIFELNAEFGVLFRDGVFVDRERTQFRRLPIVLEHQIVVAEFKF